MARQVSYIKSAVHPEDYPPGLLPEVAIAGRSNAGKSSFINTWAGGKVAHVSQTPGKTRLLNFFDVSGRYGLVDMPGYGYAARSGDEVLSWRQMIEDYLTFRENLCGLVLVMDVRRDWSEDEELIKRFCESQGLSFLVALTKTDKLSRSQQMQEQKKIRKQAQMEDVWLTSALKKVGVEEIESKIYSEWLKPKMKKKIVEEDK